MSPEERSTAGPPRGAGGVSDDMTGKVVVITGANSGIGRAAAGMLVRKGATVVITARHQLRGKQVLAELARRARDPDQVRLVMLDTSKMRSVRAGAAELLDTCERIDVLVNNAGAILSDRRVTEDGFEMTFAGNHLGHFLLTELLCDRLVQSAPARVITVSSVVHRLVGSMTWTDLQHETLYNGTLAYNESKLANALFAMELARRLDGTGVVSNCLHPGAVRSGWGSGGDTRGLERLSILFAQPFMVTSHRGAQPIVRLASLPKFETATGGYYVGGYLGRCSKHTPSSAALDPIAGRRLWEVSEELVASTSI